VPDGRAHHRAHRVPGDIRIRAPRLCPEGIIDQQMGAGLQHLVDDRVAEQAARGQGLRLLGVVLPASSLAPGLDEELLAPFQVKVLASDPNRDPTLIAESKVEYVELDELLERADVVSLHLPYSPEVHHLLGEERLRRMKSDAVLINCARGGLVDEAALRRAITREHLRGAALDVLEHETDGRNPFADLRAVIVTPHLGGGSRGSVSRVVERSAANIGRFLAGEPVRDVIPGLIQARS